MAWFNSLLWLSNIPYIYISLLKNLSYEAVSTCRVNKTLNIHWLLTLYLTLYWALPICCLIKSLWPLNDTGAVIVPISQKRTEVQRTTLPHRQNGYNTQTQLLGAEMQLIALRIKEKVFFRIYKVQDDLTQEPKSQFQEFSFLLLTSAWPVSGGMPTPRRKIV